MNQHEVQPETPGIRRKHNQSVLESSAISTMFRSGLLGGANMEQQMALYNLTCIDSKLGWYNFTPTSTVFPFMHASVCVWV